MAPLFQKIAENRLCVGFVFLTFAFYVDRKKAGSDVKGRRKKICPRDERAGHGFRPATLSPWPKFFPEAKRTP